MIIAVANVIAVIPITIYGLGTREITLIGLFSILNFIGHPIAGVATLLFIDITIRTYEEIEKQRTQIHPVLRDFFGGIDT